MSFEKLKQKVLSEIRDCEYPDFDFQNKVYQLNINNPEILDDYQIAYEAIQNNYNNYQYISDRLKNEKSLVELAVNNHGAVLEYVPDSFKSDKEIVKMAVDSDVWSFMYASQSIKDDRDFVMELSKEYGFITILSSDRLKNDLELLDIAMNSKKERVGLFELVANCLLSGILPDLERLKEEGVGDKDLIKEYWKLQERMKQNRELIIEAVSTKKEIKSKSLKI